MLCRNARVRDRRACLSSFWNGLVGQGGEGCYAVEIASWISIRAAQALSVRDTGPVSMVALDVCAKVAWMVGNSLASSGNAIRRRFTERPQRSPWAGQDHQLPDAPPPPEEPPPPSDEPSPDEPPPSENDPPSDEPRPPDAPRERLATQKMVPKIVRKLIGKVIGRIRSTHADM